MNIKSVPEDFVVEEIPGYLLSDSGDYAICRMIKTNLTTEQAVDRICRLCRLQRKDVKYAGTKDKNAITTQYISVFNPKQKIELKEDRLTVEFVGYSSEPLSLGTLQGNKFKIIVKDLDDTEMNRFNVRISNIAELGAFSVPNYFDDQRFSTNNVEVGLAMLNTDYKKAVELIINQKIEYNLNSYEELVKHYITQHPTDYIGAIKNIPLKILTLYVHAVQSYIYNKSLTQLLTEHSEQNLIGAFAYEYSMGKLIFYDNPNNYPQDVEDTAFDKMQLVGFGIENYDLYTRQMMQKLGLTTRSFIIRAIPDLSVDGTSRECLAKVHEFIYTEINEKTLRLEFSLDKGSYATIVLKALF